MSRAFALFVAAAALFAGWLALVTVSETVAVLVGGAYAIVLLGYGVSVSVSEYRYGLAVFLAVLFAFAFVAVLSGSPAWALFVGGSAFGWSAGWLLADAFDAIRART